MSQPMLNLKDLAIPILAISIGVIAREVIPPDTLLYSGVQLAMITAIGIYFTIRLARALK